MSFLGILNAGGVIITALATAILAFITWRYVLLTRKMLEANNKPEILIFLFPSEGSAYSINLCIQNIGTGFASNVKFTGDLSFKSLYYNLPLKHMGIFKNGIDYLPPGRNIEMPLFHTQSIPKMPKKSLNITVTYTDSMEIKYKEAFVLEFNKWIGFRQIQKNSLDKIASVLDDISRKL